MQGYSRLYVISDTDTIASLTFGELRETTLGAQSWRADTWAWF